MIGDFLEALDAGAIPARPGVGMRLASAGLGRRARRREGKPVDLVSERSINDWLTRRMRVPAGVVARSREIGGVPVVSLSPAGGGRGTVLFLHGGAYVMGAARQALTMAHLVSNGGPEIISVEYRLAPEHPHPAAVVDALSVYRELVSMGAAEQIVVMGESAGGGLAMLLLQRARDENLPMPRLAVAAFPWVDLTVSGDSATSNLGRDLLTNSELQQEARLFAPSLDLGDPAVSPLFGSFVGMPATYVAVGTRDLLLDDARRLAAAMRRDGTQVRLEEWPGAVHGFSALPVREGRLYRQRLRQLIDAALPPDLPPDLDSRPTDSRWSSP